MSDEEEEEEEEDEKNFPLVYMRIRTLHAGTVGGEQVGAIAQTILKKVWKIDLDPARSSRIAEAAAGN